MIHIDTDVLVDAANDREPFSEASTRFLDLISVGIEPACVAWHTISNLHYVARPKPESPDIRSFIEGLAKLVTVVPTSNADLLRALRLPMRDFEDAMQVAAAMAAGARLIVTRDLEDYRNSPIRAISPASAIAELS